MNTSLIKIAAPIGVLMAGIGAYVLLDATKPEPEKKEEPPRALSVFVHSVNRSDIPLKVTTQGEVRARTQVDIVAQVSGRIVEVSPEFIEGGVVKPGDPLVVIESTDYEFAVKSSRAQVAEAEVRLQQALADADVARKQLRDSKDPSPLALKKPQVASAEASLRASEAILSQAETNLARTRISLPFNGRVISKSVDVGQFVTAGT
ncbi:MAG: efflux RND transporter periplasmic adaptor subunit [Pseudomonadales bacterium]